MDALPKVGRFLFALPMAAFGVMHFMNGQAMVGMVPVPGGIIWVYLTGAALLAAALAIMIGQQAVLATRLLALFLLLTAFTVHLPVVLGGDQMAMGQVLKDVALAGGSLILSGVFAHEAAHHADA